LGSFGQNLRAVSEDPERIVGTRWVRSAKTVAPFRIVCAHDRKIGLVKKKTPAGLPGPRAQFDVIISPIIDAPERRQASAVHELCTSVQSPPFARMTPTLVSRADNDSATTYRYRPRRVVALRPPPKWHAHQFCWVSL